MAIFGARGIRDSVRTAYRKHRELFEEERPPSGISRHQAALHGALVLRYAAAYRAVPEGVVWLELVPFLPLPPEEGLEALAEYVVFKERRRGADLRRLRDWIARGMAELSGEDRRTFLEAAGERRFLWLSLLEPNS